MKGFSVCQELLGRANGYTKCGPYLLAASLAAALLNGSRSIYQLPANQALEACQETLVRGVLEVCSVSLRSRRSAPPLS